MITYTMRGHIDSNNAEDFEAAVRNAFSDTPPETLVLDARDLDYISSAGLRAVLRLSKEIPEVHMIDVRPSVYEVLDMTGFTQLITVEKALRTISVEGCPEIGRGAHGVVYRIAPDTIVKVFNPGEDLADIKKERELSRWAFVRGVPTAIPYDIVQVGDQYGTVFELLDARSSVDYVKESPEHLDDFIQRSVQLMKQIHAIQVEPGELPNMRQQMLEWTAELKDSFDAQQAEHLLQIVSEVPDTPTLLHADLHLKNIMMCEGELMLIDMDTLCMGDPIFDLATIYNSYREFPSIDEEAAAFLGIDVKTAYAICDRTFELYLEDADEQSTAITRKQAQILGCIRIMHYMTKQLDHPAREHALTRCREDIAKLLAG